MNAPLHSRPQSDPGQEPGYIAEEDRRYVETQNHCITASHGPFPCDDGSTLSQVNLTYETYGTLNHDKSNAILIFHALTGGAHAAFWYPGDKRPGWWDTMIGPGKAFDTNRFFVICVNVLGSCYGSTGPTTINPETGKIYGLDFPTISIRDMVRAQAWLLDDLGIDVLVAVAGGSMGGMQALQYAVSYPKRAKGIIAVATTTRHNAQQIAFNEVGRQAIMRDRDWNHGRYEGEGPAGGLALARMVGHITYLSEEGMHHKFGRRLRTRDSKTNPFDIEFEVGSYLDYQGRSFTKRFDANSYLYLTKAIDTFDLSEGFTSLQAALAEAPKRFLLITFSSDWLYPPGQLREVARALRQAGKSATYCEIDSIYGHDSFLLPNQEQEEFVRGFLNALERGAVK